MHTIHSDNVPEIRTERESRPTLADILRIYGSSYISTHPLPPTHLKVIKAIIDCRTAMLGGHMHVCDSCGYEHPVYNSCGNRHCPQCQSIAKEKWLQARMQELLPVPYFHTVFTLPHLLNPLARYNKKIIYDILFRSVSQTLLQFGANPKNGIGGKIGFIAILHTWDQKLLQHIHLHCVVPAGAISPDGTVWIHPKKDDFLFPVRQLSIVFRAKFINELKLASSQKILVGNNQISCLASQSAFYSLIQQLFVKDWVVYAKKPFAGPQQVLNYLSSYTHKIAISNHRIRSLENGIVTFSFRNSRNNNQTDTMSLPVDSFISRFLAHVLPRSYMRIRHFGFLFNRNRTKSIALARYLLGCKIELTSPQTTTTQHLMLALTKKDISQCPKCKSGTLFITKTIPKFGRPLRVSLHQTPLINDSS